MAANWFNSLKLVAGALTTDEAALDAHAVQGVKPACVVAPETAAQAALVIKFAAAEKIPVLPRGGGTGQGIGSPPPGNSIALSTRRMNRLVSHEPDDMVATVQAGMELGALQAELAKNGQWLPLDGDPHSTIGGLIATDRSGPRALGYGTLRDMVLGLSIVNGDGVFRKCGGKVVKNVTGYDLAKLYIGSMGTLGLVTEVNFKLRPLPIARRLWQFGASDFSQGAGTLKNIAEKNLPLECLYLFYAREAAQPWQLTVEAAGTEIELERISREVASSLQGAAGNLRQAALGPEAYAGDPAWTAALKAAAPANTALHFWCRNSQLSEVWSLLSASASCAVFRRDGGTAALTLKNESAANIGASLAEMGINFRFENANGLKIDQPFGPPRPEWALMKQIRAALDPLGIMNPGRFIV